MPEHLVREASWARHCPFHGLLFRDERVLLSNRPLYNQSCSLFPLGFHDGDCGAIKTTESPRTNSISDCFFTVCNAVLAMLPHPFSCLYPYQHTRT
jgi:hypothetical protein